MFKFIKHTITNWPISIVWFAVIVGSLVNIYYQLYPDSITYGQYLVIFFGATIIAGMMCFVYLFTEE